MQFFKTTRSLLGELGSIFQENGFTGHCREGLVDAMEVVSMEKFFMFFFWKMNQNHIVGCFVGWKIAKAFQMSKWLKF